MLNYEFENRKKLSKYEFLYRCLRSDILNGKLYEGMKMPSKRELAKANNISVKTVMNAYDQLIMEGYLISKERSGYYVASNFSHNIRYQNIPFELPAPESFKEWKADFTSNTIVYEKFPFSTWTKVMQRVFSEYHVSLMKRGDFLGNRELRVEIAKYLYRNRGMIVSADCIVIGTGIEYLYSKLIRLLPKHSVYAVEDPGYKKIPLIYDDLDVKWTPLKMDQDGIQMKSLHDSQATIVHTSPEHHYPLGTVMSAKRRQELLKWLELSKDHYIIEDDYDCEFRYKGHPISALYGMDQSHRVIYMNTFSKTLSPAIRISYMVLPEELLEKYIHSANFFSNTSSNLEQYTLAHFIKDGYFERHLNRMRKCYHAHGEELLDAVTGTPSLPVKAVSAIESGTHLLVRLDTKLTDIEIKQRAESIGIHLQCLSDFCIRKEPKYDHILVLNYSIMEQKMIRKIIEELGWILQ